jgi:hypothetical protein
MVENSKRTCVKLSISLFWMEVTTLLSTTHQKLHWNLKELFTATQFNAPRFLKATLA